MIRVLIVEDFELVRRGIKSSLSREDDIEIVAEVGNAEDAVKETLRLKPDVVLMDIKLGEDEDGGIKATREIKENLKDCRVLILTFFDDSEHVFRAVKAKVDGYLLKDVDKEELVKAIRTINRGKSVIHPDVAFKLLNMMSGEREKEEKKREIQHNLSDREMEVLQLLTTGATNRDIAEKLFISETTVKAHVSSILRKMNVNDRTQAVIKAFEIKLFD